MNPRTTASDSVKVDTRSPFERITHLENTQETRVQEMLAAYAEEERGTQKSLALAQEVDEEETRKKATEDLREYVKKEPADILKQGELATKEELQEISKSYTKNTPKAVETLAASVFDLL